MTMTFAATGCMIEPEDDANEQESLSQTSQALRLVQSGDNECAYTGTVTCTHAALGTQTHQHTEYVRASEHGGTCPPRLLVEWQLNGWSCQGIISQPRGPLEQEQTKDVGGDRLNP